MGIRNECASCFNRNTDSMLCESCRWKGHKKVYIAIRAAQNLKRWGYFAALQYCKKRGVAENVLEAAIWCNVNERREDCKKLPLFLKAQAG